MFTLRCTRRLLDRMRVEPVRQLSRPSTVLGDWYANIIYFGERQFLLAVSERTLLPVLLPAARAKTFARRLPAVVAEMLVALGVPDGAIDRELAEMASFAVGATANRQVLGSMNDFARMLEVPQDPGESLLSAALLLSEAPCGPIGMESPRRAAVAAFAQSVH